MNLPDSFKNAEIPTFPFPKTIMNYIFTNARAVHYQKLNQLCKYFFATFQRNCVSWLHLEENYYDAAQKPPFQGYQFKTKNPRDFDLLSPNLWVYSYIELNRATTPLYKTLMPKITKCTISNLTLTRCADFLYEDYKFLTASGEIETLYLFDTKIVYAKGEAVEFENILPHVDGATFVNVSPIHTTPNTIQSLINTQWKSKNKLMMFRLSKAANKDHINPNHFFILLQKIACMPIMKSSGRCWVRFNNDEETKAFEEILTKKIENYKRPVDVGVGGSS